jgi:hypothetical protein
VDGSLVVGTGPGSGVVVLRFPQYAEGQSVARTRIILKNNGDQTENGEVLFRNPSGDLVEVPIDGVAMSQVPITLAPWGTAEVVTDGTSSQLATGSIEVTSDRGLESNLEGTEIFDIFGNFVSVDSSPLLASMQVYVSVTERENTGMAVYNPNDDPVTLDLILLDNQGIQETTAEVTLQPGEQESRFLAVTADAVMKTFFDQNPDFQGTLNIQVRGGNTVALLGLIQKVSSRALLAVPVSAKAFLPQP